MYALDLDEKEILAGVSGDLILTLIGVTYLFAIARNNGTVDLIVRTAVRGVGGRVALIPWVMFAVTAVLTGIGAVSPAACAIIGPIALGFAGRYGISPLMMGMFVVHGAQAGGFSPISIYGVDHQLGDGGRRPAVERDHGVPRQPGGQHGHGRDPVRRPGWSQADVDADRPRRPRHPRRGPAPRRRHRAGPGHGRLRPDGHPGHGVRRDQVLTLLAFVGVALVALVFDKNIGFVSITAAVLLAMLAPRSTRTPSSRSPGRPSCWSPASAPTPRSSRRRARPSSSATGPPASVPRRSARSSSATSAASSPPSPPRPPCCR